MLATIAGSVAAIEAPVSFSVEPVEPEPDGSMVYAPIAAETGHLPATGRFWFTVAMTNQSGLSLHLNQVRATFITGGIPIVRQFARDLDLPAGDVASTELQKDEVITLSLPAPVAVAISLYFDGYDPKTVQRALVAYVNPVGPLLFPADEGDLGPEEYFSAGNVHLAPESQLWGADWSVHRIIATGSSSPIRAGGNSAVNADHLGWGIPIRAMADGVVLRTSTGWINNPTAGTRAFQLMSEFNGEDVSDVKVTRLGVTRAASLQRLPSENIQLSIWDFANSGRQITRLASSDLVSSESISDMALDALTSTQAVSVLRRTNGNLRVIVWNISEDGLTVTRGTPIESTGGTEVSVMKMTSNRFATGLRDSNGDLKIAVWQVSGGSAQVIASSVAESATSICTSALSSSRVATSFRTAAGHLKVMVWDLIDDGDGTFSLAQRGSASADAITRVAACTCNSGRWPRNKWVTVLRTNPGGLLKLIRWDASDDGYSLTSELQTLTTQPIQDSTLAIAPGSGSDGSDNVATASAIAGGIFKINGWGDPETDSDPITPLSTYEYSASNTAPAAVSNVSLDQLDKAQFIAGVRTSGGALKLMVWQWATGGGNCVYILHGDCRVLYAHFQAGSVDTNVLYPGAIVTAGQRLGLMGNSGASSGPHTHIHSERIYPVTSISNMIALEAAGALPVIGTRPIPFSGARAMRLSLIAPGGEGNTNNSFTTMNGQGMYDITLGIRPRLNTRYVDHTATTPDPTGRKEPVPGSPARGGPVPSVAQGIGVSPAGARLYIRGGSYDESIILDQPMTVRRYDFYDTDGPVIIGN